MSSRLAKLAVGIAGLPFAAGAAWAAALAFRDLFVHPRETALFLAGFAGYPLWRIAGAARQGRVYVFGHELAHALAAWGSGHRVHGFSVGRSSGHVEISRSNTFIALAPYVLPVYSLIVIAVYRLWLWRMPGSPASEAVFLAAMGLSLSFHIVATGEILWGRRQPDLDAAGGLLFSLMWIALGNGLLLTLVLKCLFPRAVSLASAQRGGLDVALGCYSALRRLF